MTDPFGPEAHDAAVPEHSKVKGHYCVEWDDLWICEDCEEFDWCWCFGKPRPAKAKPATEGGPF